MPLSQVATGVLHDAVLPRVHPRAALPRPADQEPVSSPRSCVLASCPGLRSTFKSGNLQLGPRHCWAECFEVAPWLSNEQPLLVVVCCGPGMCMQPGLPVFCFPHLCFAYLLLNLYLGNCLRVSAPVVNGILNPCCLFWWLLPMEVAFTTRVVFAPQSSLRTEKGR